MSDLIFEDVINNLSNDDVNIRKEAINALVGLNDESIIDPLIKATTDDNAQIRFKAAEIFDRPDVKGREAILRIMQKT